MKKHLYKSLAWVLTLCMVLALLPKSALAVGGVGELSITGTSGTDYSVSGGVINILKDTAMTISGTTTIERIVVEDDVTANLTFSGVSITAIDTSPILVGTNSTLNLTLAGDSKLIGSGYGTVGIAVSATANLNISGTGSLSAVGSNAGIGGNSANIAITGGTVTAKGTDNYSVGIGGDDCTVSISGANTIVNAYGLYNGIGAASYSGAFESISISGGTITAWSACSIGGAPDYTVSYNDSYSSNSQYGIGGASGTISITGGTVDARARNIGIGGNEVTAINIGGTVVVNAVATINSGGIGIGGNLKTGTRAITVGGNAVVGAWNNFNGTGYTGGSIIGGGDNSNSTITIKDNAVVKSASDIGSADFYSGYAGGTIQILNGASIQNPDASYLSVANHIGGANCENANGGAGGSITINTTGTVSVGSIGGGNGENGGDGGNITIQNGKIMTNHIGGGDGSNGLGGSGGTISISGGQVGDYSGGSQTPSGSTENKVGYGENTRYYSAAGIGGGGGSEKGGNGGSITITGGKVRATSGVTVYDPATGNTAPTGTGVGGAGIGGGNGANGGTISISGGYVEVNNADVRPYEATSATAVPALIGGGSGGGAGEITISGGYVNAGISPLNAAVYGGDATSIGQGKGATEAGGFVKVTGGMLYVEPNVYANPNAKTNPVAQPKPWPTAADGSNPVYMANFSFYSAVGIPDGLNLYDCPIVSMTLKDKTTGQVYSYGTKDMLNRGYFWLPVGDTSGWGWSAPDLYDIELKIKKDNTVYAFDGTIYYQKNENIIGGILGGTKLTFKGEVTETLKLTSNWGTGVKVYNGTDQKPNFNVTNMNGDTLTEGTDYILNIDYSGTTVPEIRNAGSYTVTATGKAGTAYAGMTATLTDIHINPKEIQGIYNGATTFTKQYDGNEYIYNGSSKIEELELTVDPSGICSGDVLTNIKAPYPRYTSTGVGTNIPLTSNGVNFTYTQNGQSSNIFNYSILLPVLTGDITVKVLGETSFDVSNVTVSKTYDGTTGCTLSNVNGNVTLNDLVGDEVSTVNITAVSAFDSKDVGNSRTVKLTIGDLTGANSGNYQLAGGSNTVDITNAKILPADYAYNLTPAQQAQQFTQGRGLSQIDLPQTATGISSEMVTGTVSLWHDAACITSQADDTSVNALTVGTHNLYVKFVPAASETNYTNKVTTGKVVVLTVVEGEPQTMSWNGGVSGLMTTYGIGITGKTATTNADGGAISYSSSNENVAAVNANTGELTIKGAGTATIIATAAKVEGKYRATSITYPLTVSKKNVTVTADNKDRIYGEANPALTFTHTPSDLVGADTVDALAVNLSCAATATSPAGTPVSITGTSASANYDVTVTPGELTITKAGAPTVGDINISLLYSEAHTDVIVNITGLPADSGTTSCAAITVTGDTGIINGSIVNTATGIKFSTNSGMENQFVTIPVTVTMQNYADTTVNVVVKLVNKIPVTITGVVVSDKTYDGMAAAYTGTPSNEQGYTGTYEYVWSSGSVPKDKGSYTLTVRIPDSSETHMGKLEIVFTISPKALTAKPKNISIYNGEALPSTFELEYVGIVSGDSITVSGVPAFALQKADGSSLENSNTNGSYVIKWTNSDEITLTNSNYSLTKADGTLTISSRSSGGEVGGGTVAPPPTDTKPEVSTVGDKSTATVTADTKTSGNTTTATVGDNVLKNAIAAAEKAAAENKTAPAIEIKVETEANTDTLQVTLPKASLKTVADSKAESLTISSGIGQIIMSNETATSIAKQAGGTDVSVSVGKVDKDKDLNEKQKSAVGDAPVYDISITSGNKHITSFDGGLMTISLPYTLKPGENPGGIVVWYVDEQGNVQKVISMYDVKTKMIIFSTNHLSKYAIGYDKDLIWVNPFTDVAEDAWYFEAVRFCAARGITTGTSATTFGPEADVTRGQFIVMLMRAYKIEPDSTSGNNFADAGNTYYTNYLAKAKELGITSGVGNNMFAPERKITRQDMFTLIYRALDKLGKLPKVANSKNLSDFSDAASISDYAKDAMTALVQSGIVSGSDGKLNPQGVSTRSQLVQVLYNLLPK